MKIVKFTNPDGSVLGFVNMDKVATAFPDRDGWVSLLNDKGESLVKVPLDQFIKAAGAESPDIVSLRQTVMSLKTALERLTVHIPTSIRMHM